MRKSVRFALFAALICPTVTVLLATTESLAGGKGGRGRQQITRSGPASHGSYGRTQRSRGNDDQRRKPPQPGDRVPGPRAREVVNYTTRNTNRNTNPQNQAFDRQRDDRDRSSERDDYRDRDRDQVRDQDDYRDREPHVVARRHRIWHRGDELTYVEYGNYGCGDVAVVVDDDKYYRCEGTWFVRTYYGGEVTYTATDPPSGY